ncbi:MAG TPA: ABC transporter ATP-binding protein [Gemmatimonadales bacterium]|nr:ABC transporter ATP-binding protein [Gemmatimonadales bacterium]
MSVPAGEPPVVVHEIEKRFGDAVALAGVSFEVQPAELFGLVGPDGAGKTTLLRILSTLLVPDAGRATVLGLNVVNDMWEVRSRLGYMPGKFSLYQDLTVEENLRFFAAVFGTTPEQGYETIAPIYSHIEPFADRRAGALSGGMKQKLALSCALVHRPDILLLDEPTTGVDAVSRREFWDLLHELQSTGLTIVVSTPYMDEASRCDRVALIQQGGLLAVDEPSRIGMRFPHPLFSVRTNERYRMIQVLRQYEHAVAVHPFGEVLHYSDARADSALIAASVQEFLAANGFTDVDVRRVEPGIEDTFMALMGAPAESAA